MNGAQTRSFRVAEACKRRSSSFSELETRFCTARCDRENSAIKSPCVPVFMSCGCISMTRCIHQAKRLKGARIPGPSTCSHQIAPVRIVTQDVGFTDRSGTVWKPDDFFFRGRVIARSGTVNGPNDPQVYERERYGNFWYAIPVAGGSYTLRLYFTESYWGPNLQGGGGVDSRVFDVYCNGSALLRNFDMYREAGAQRQIVKTFSGLRPCR